MRKIWNRKDKDKRKSVSHDTNSPNIYSNHHFVLMNTCLHNHTNKDRINILTTIRIIITITTATTNTNITTLSNTESHEDTTSFVMKIWHPYTNNHIRYQINNPQHNTSTLFINYCCFYFGNTE